MILMTTLYVCMYIYIYIYIYIYKTYAPPPLLVHARGRPVVHERHAQVRQQHLTAGGGADCRCAPQAHDNNC